MREPAMQKLVEWARARGAVLLTALRRITGMPDYAAYCAHLRTAHPDRRLPTEREFFDDYLRHRYESGPTRCC